VQPVTHRLRQQADSALDLSVDLASDKIKYQGYYPGVVGKITELHAIYYYENWGFDVTFETQVGRELSEFVRDFQKQRDGLWVATVDGRFAGAIAIDGHLAESEGARLRWFIVDPAMQGTGIGNALISRAVAFCKTKGFRTVFLWTFEGLHAARTLYERHGFRFALEAEIRQWGQTIKEQKFELII
jgi:GNAT superfamily N-acetyltransferase